MTHKTENKMKKLSLYIASLALTAVGFASCDDDFERPPMVLPESDWTANMTIEDFKAKYWNTVETTPVTVGLNEQGDSIILKGRVCSSDKTGNIFKYLMVQGESEAIAISLDFYDICNTYKFGQEVYINATGLTIGGYSGLMCLGDGVDDRGRVSRAAEALFSLHAQVNGLPVLSDVDTVSVTIPVVDEAKTSAEGLQKWQSQLIRLNNVRFENAGEEFAPAGSPNNAAERYVVDENGNRIMVRNSTYADFKNETLPYGYGSVVGILSYFGTNWQILLNDAGGCMDFNGVATPVFSPVAGVVAEGTEVTISCETEGAEIHYTLDGSDPTIESPLYTEAIVISETTTVKAIATKAGHDASIVVTARYTVSADAPSDGDGTEAKPYTASQIIALNPTSKDEAVATGVWVKGYIVGSMPKNNTTLANTIFGANAEVASNLVVGPTPDTTDPSVCISVQLISGSDIRAALNLLDNPGNIGKLVEFKGDVMLYCGGAGIKNASEYKFEGQGGGDTPAPPAGDAIFSETFLNGNLGQFTATVETSSTWTGWRANTQNPLCALANSYTGGENKEGTAWLVSPEISLAGVTSASISFEQAFGFHFPTAQDEFCVVNVREKGGQWKALTMTVFPPKPEKNWSEWVENTLDISEFAGKTIEIGFKYYNDGKQSVAWEIRNLTVK